ncbi:unnamed protein product [Schistosoma curassoni]|uniref:Ion transport domain-containing protein n=1 Tax=Schistosoma curassoni TaxID=6186 RepID=A0A183KJR7_9TREM|nr:unnamed protein product [Schistosoma curassoni]
MNNQHQQRTIKNVGYRLGKRKRLFEKRCRISDFSLSFAVFGILVMLVETELIFAGVYEKLQSLCVVCHRMIYLMLDSHCNYFSSHQWTDIGENTTKSDGSLARILQ